MSRKISLCKQNSTRNKKVDDHDHGQRKGTCTKSCDFGAVRYVKHVCHKVAAAVVVGITSTAVPPKPRGSDSNDNGNKERGAKRSVAPVDSQRAEAIHDCIDFINSSSAFPRSNSVAR